MEKLTDPLGDRVMKKVPPIIRKVLKRADFWQKQFNDHKLLPNIEILKNHLKYEG